MNISCNFLALVYEDGRLPAAGAGAREGRLPAAGVEWVIGRIGGCRRPCGGAPARLVGTIPHRLLSAPCGERGLRP